MSEIMTYTKIMFDPLHPDVDLIDIPKVYHVYHTFASTEKAAAAIRHGFYIYFTLFKIIIVWLVAKGIRCAPSA